MKTDTCYCRNVDCQFYGFTGQRARLIFHAGPDGTPRFRCTQCDHLVSARAGTAYAGFRTNECTYQSGARHLAGGWADEK